MSVTERINDRALALDAPGLADVLRSLDRDQRAAARAWVLNDKTFLGGPRSRGTRSFRAADLDTRALDGSRPWTHAMCIVSLCTPAEAARAIRWDEIWNHMMPVAREHALSLVIDHSTEWVEKFTATSSSLNLSGKTMGRCGWQLAWLVAEALEAHDLPCPGGRTFLAHHGGFSRHDPDALPQFRANRLNPDLVYLKIAAGFAHDYDGLHTSVRQLVDEGQLDRDRLIDVCLQALTTPGRVSSQRALAKTLTALDLAPSDVPGAMPFLTDIFATSDGSVGMALLPLALRVAAETADVDGLEELTRVVAGRPERKQKQVFLVWLSSPAAVACVGPSVVLGLLELLADGQADASLLRGIEKARIELGAPTAGVPERGVTNWDLWDADLDPGPRSPRPSWMGAGGSGSDLQTFLDRRQEEYKPATEFVVEDFVHSLITETGVATFVESCRQLRVDGNLAVSRVTRLMEAGFLAGGLRVLWAAALDIADDIVSAGRTPPGLPDLLRLLTGYATGVPNGAPLPTHLGRVAASAGNSKTQLEARALVRALHGVPLDADHPAPSEQARAESRGLWDLRASGPVLGQLLDPDYPRRQLTPNQHLTYLLAVGHGLADRRLGPELAASADAGLVHQLSLRAQPGNADAVRRLVARTPRQPGADDGPTCAALRVWQDRHLTSASYQDVLAQAFELIPVGLDRIVFGWTCEQLVRLETHPGLLSAPGRPDGAVTASSLLNRLQSLAGVGSVGPLDLLLALTRLHVDADEIDRLLVGLQEVAPVWTDPAVTRAGDGGTSFDVVPVVRRWVALGGMTESHLSFDMGLVGPLTEADLRGPAGHEDVRYRVWPLDPSVPQRDPGVLSARALTVLHDGALPGEAWHRVLDDVVADHSNTRERMLDYIVQLSRFDVLDPSVSIPIAVTLLAEGRLPLGRFTDSLQWLFERGAMRQLWPLGMALAGAAGSMARKPTALPGLLAMMSGYAPEVAVDARTVPPEIAAIAAAPAPSKSREAARALVGALSQPTDVCGRGPE